MPELSPECPVKNFKASDKERSRRLYDYTIYQSIRLPGRGKAAPEAHNQSGSQTLCAVR